MHASQVSKIVAHRIQLPASALVVAGAVTALLGVYWDEAWHTDLGRDTFWSPPRLLLHAGVGLGRVGGRFLDGAGVSAGGARAIFQQPTLLLAGAVVTPASAPMDDTWHVQFGRDAVMWSPPQLLGLASIVVGRGSPARLSPHRWPAGRSLTPLAAAGLLASVLVLAFGYDADVPQFAVVWYLPVVSGSASLAFNLATRVAPGRIIASRLRSPSALLWAVGLVLAGCERRAAIVPSIAAAASSSTWRQ